MRKNVPDKIHYIKKKISCFPTLHREKSDVLIWVENVLKIERHF